jgi:hypothetical protein
MTDKNFTNSQSPRASRSSTNDPLAHSKGKVQTDMGEPSNSDGINDNAWRIRQDRGGDGYRPV